MGLLSGLVDRTKSDEGERRFPAGAGRANAVLVIEEPGVSANGKLDRFGVGQNFVIADHAAVADQDFRGKVGVDLVRISVLGRSLFDRKVEVPEFGPFCFGNFRLDGLCKGQRCGVRLESFEVGDPALGQIHFEADGSRRPGLRRFFCFREAVESNMLALANGVLANAGFHTKTLAGEKTCFEEQAISVIPG